MADVLAVRDAYRAQQWEMVVQECAASGLSNREFCRQRGILEKSFYYWQRKLRQQIVCKFRHMSHICTDFQPRCHGVSATPSRSGATVVRGAGWPL